MFDVLHSSCQCFIDKSTVLQTAQHTQREAIERAGEVRLFWEPWENSIRILRGQAVVFLILLWMRNARRESGQCDTARDCSAGWIWGPADLQRQATEISGDGWWRPCDLSVTSYSLWPSAGRVAILLRCSQPKFFGHKVWPCTRQPPLRSTGAPGLPDEISRYQPHGHTEEINTGKRKSGGWDSGSGTKVMHPSTATRMGSGHTNHDPAG